MRTGLTQLLSAPRSYLADARVGLVANATTITADFYHAADVLHEHPEVKLTTLFGPEHGIRGIADYLENVAGERDPTGLPVHSLYGKSFASLTPSPAQLAQLDTLIFDIQDVGSRYYTYAATMALCMQAARAAGKKMVVLDRPNPIGGLQIEGGGLLPALANFCGLYPVPQRHAMTVGELARLYNRTFGIGCDLEVVPCEGWRRADYYEATGLPWVMPSPAMPTVDTAVVYPGMCLLEGTNVSEGRGTTRPFELFGAAYIDARALVKELRALKLPGVAFRACAFRPTIDKFAGVECQGAQLHVTCRRDFLPFATALGVICCIRALWPHDFAWRREPYEFRDDVPAFDLLCGTPAVRQAIDAGADFAAVQKAALFGTDAYEQARPAALLYT